MACSKPVPSAISFAEIVQGRDATVRVTPDGMICVIDLVMVMTGQDRNYAGFTLRRLPEEDFPSHKYCDRRFPGKGNAHMKVVSMKDALILVMVLPGKTAKETRTKFANILERYMAGDGTLHAEIQANASSSSPIAQMARGSLGLQSVVDEQLIGFKRKREELELLKLEEEIKGMAQTRILTAAAELERIIDPTRSNLDDRTRLMIQDSLQNSLLNRVWVLK